MGEEKKKRGAPKKRRGKKTGVLNIRISKDDERLLRELSEDTGFSKAEILRRGIRIVLNDIKRGDDVFGLNAEIDRRNKELETKN